MENMVTLKTENVKDVMPHVKHAPELLLTNVHLALERDFKKVLLVL